MDADPSTPREPRWGLGDAAIGLIPFALTGLTALLTLGDDTDQPDPTVTALAANSLLLWLFIVGVPIVATRLKGNGPVADLGLRFAPVDGLAFLVGVGLQALAVPALYWPVFRLTDVSSDDVSRSAQDLVDSAHGVGVVVLVLIVCVGAPFAEELFFRGLLLRSLDRRWGAAAAVVVATLVFGVAHFQGLQLPALLLFGAVAGVLAIRSGRLGPAILCHVGFNAWTVFQLLVLDR